MTLHDVAALYRRHRDPPEVIAAYTPAEDLAYAIEYLSCTTCGMLHGTPALLEAVLARCTQLGQFDWSLLGPCHRPRPARHQEPRNRGTGQADGLTG